MTCLFNIFKSDYFLFKYKSSVSFFLNLTFHMNKEVQENERDYSNCMAINFTNYALILFKDHFAFMFLYLIQVDRVLFVVAMFWKFLILNWHIILYFFVAIVLCYPVCV